QLKGDELAYLAGARGNEHAHYAALKGVLKSATPKNLKFKYPTGAFGSRKSIGMLGQALETAFVGAYMGAVTSLQSNELKSVAAADPLEPEVVRILAEVDELDDCRPGDDLVPREGVEELLRAHLHARRRGGERARRRGEHERGRCGGRGEESHFRSAGRASPA